MSIRLLTLIFATALASASLAQAPSSAPRPPLSAPKDAKFYNGKWYAVIQDKMSWQAARDKCARLGGQLVVIPDKDTWDFVNGLTQTRVWLGATDEKVEGEWIWVDGSKMSYTVWTENNPDNMHAKEHYLTTTPGKDAWNDMPKNWDAYGEFPVVGFICEWKAR